MTLNRELFAFCRFAARVTGETPFKLAEYIRDFELHKYSTSFYAEFITVHIHEGNITITYKEYYEVPQCRTFNFPFADLVQARGFFESRFVESGGYYTSRKVLKYA